MMVTFVAQCEKKSLNKTRRVLDSFANRIGSRTWQTVITLEGLKAVKKLLRKTASKNTAVSCHWIRSRSRSELVWIVGSREKFNIQGFVPVNYTDGELFMDEIEIKSEKIFANTKHQPLTHHLFAVGVVAYQIIKQFVEDEMLAKTVFVAGCLHDIGKIDPAFQEWLVGEIKKKKLSDSSEEGQHITKLSGKFSFENHPRHNEISLLLYFLLRDGSYKKINKRNKDRIKHLLYWHHAKPIRKNEFKELDIIYKKFKKNIGNGNFTTILHMAKSIIAEIDNLAEKYFADIPLKLAEGFQEKIDDDLFDELDDERLPEFKKYKNDDEIEFYITKVNLNAKNNLARAAVITADRLVSALSGEELATHISEKTLSTLLHKALIQERGLKAEIQDCLDDFNARFPGSERNRWQTEAAEDLSKVESVAILNGAAGCGKTKIALEWAVKTNAKKIIWVCPRVQVCQGLINDLTSDGSDKSGKYLPNAKIEINTGEFKFIYQNGNRSETPEGKEFSGDVVITTIDQITNAILTHRSVTSLIDYMAAHVVFDEFHEYINMSAFNLLFAELVQCKKLQEEKARVLLVSATPNYYFVEEFLGVDSEDIVGIKSFNQSQYQLRFTSFDEAEQNDLNPLYQGYSPNTFVISNTAITAQRSFIDNQNNENALLLHSKFKKADKEKLFELVVDSFKQNGTHEYGILRSGPVVQASLNISCDQMVTEFTHAENWLQRLGRLDRFGENSEINLYITAVPQTLCDGKQSGGCARFLNTLHSLQSAKHWYEFLTDQLTDRTVGIREIYQLYYKFYQDDRHRGAVEQDFIKALKKSVEVINKKVLDPVSIPRKQKPKDAQVKIKKHSLRGDNRFVQMALCRVSGRNSIDYLDEYAYPEESLEANLTTPVDLICGYGDSKQDLLAFMAKKHHNIRKVKKSYKDRILLNEARNPETPVYLSYIPCDLQKVGSEPHPNAIYYALGNKQPIGAISIDKLTIKGE